MADARPTVALVIPCYNEEEVLPETARQLAGLLDSLTLGGLIGPASHVCFVDDGSTDATWTSILALSSSDPRFGGIRLSRNRGHQNALLAGLMTVTGDLVISMDADLQDDPAAIMPMLEAAARGADIVYGVRSARKSDIAAKRLTAHAFYRLLRWLGVEVVFDHADYRLMTRRALEALREYEESNLFLRALIPRLGFRTEIVYYERAERFAGESKYPLARMLALAFEGITSFSTRPLRLITVLGIITSLFALVLTTWALLAAAVFGATIPGWASTVIPIYLICGVQLLSVGVIGEYVGKIYLETKRRPRYHVADETNVQPFGDPVFSRAKENRPR